nr:hypothetical protein [Tanacetum cinerariifolium]
NKFSDKGQGWNYARTWHSRNHGPDLGMHIISMSLMFSPCLSICLNSSSK